jgi:hypothetical protein
LFEANVRHEGGIKKAGNRAWQQRLYFVYRPLFLPVK